MELLEQTHQKALGFAFGYNSDLFFEAAFDRRVPSFAAPKGQKLTVSYGVPPVFPQWFPALPTAIIQSSDASLRNARIQG